MYDGKKEEARDEDMKGFTFLEQVIKRRY